jgi:hypothetical protein
VKRHGPARPDRLHDGAATENPSSQSSNGPR